MKKKSHWSEMMYHLGHPCKEGMIFARRYPTFTSAWKAAPQLYKEFVVSTITNGTVCLDRICCPKTRKKYLEMSASKMLKLVKRFIKNKTL